MTSIGLTCFRPCSCKETLWKPSKHGGIVIDMADAELASPDWSPNITQHKNGWHRVTSVRRLREDGRRDALHRLILKAPPGLFGDHISGNVLDNRRSNLRLATPAQNNQNAAKRQDEALPAWAMPWKRRYRGVTLTGRGLWRARIQAGGRTRELGFFRSQEEAAAAYAKAAQETYGSFARVQQTLVHSLNRNGNG